MAKEMAEQPRGRQVTKEMRCRTSKNDTESSECVCVWGSHESMDQQSGERLMIRRAPSG